MGYLLMALQWGVVELGRGAVADDGSLRAVIAGVGGDFRDGVVILGGRDALLRSAVLDLRPANCMRCQTRSYMAAAGAVRETASACMGIGDVPFVCFSASNGSFELMSRVTVQLQRMWITCTAALRGQAWEWILAGEDICSRRGWEAGMVAGRWQSWR